MTRNEAMDVAADPVFLKRVEFTMQLQARTEAAGRFDQAQGGESAKRRRIQLALSWQASSASLVAGVAKCIVTVPAISNATWTTNAATTAAAITDATLNTLVAQVFDGFLAAP